MQDSHASFTEAMLRPGFFSDSPSGKEPLTSTEVTEPTVVNEVKASKSVSEIRNETLPPWIPFSDFPKQHNLIKPPLLVDGLLHQGTKMILAGAPKRGKTWAIMHLGISVATGTEFWGMETTQGGVLYLDFEITPCFAQDRLWSVLQSKGITAPPPAFKYWPLRGVCYEPETVLKVLEERLNEINDLKLLICDPIYKMAANIDENHSGSVTALLLTLEKFSERTGAAICFSHHFNKSAGDSNHMNNMSGSNSFSRDPDTILTLKAHSRHPEVTVVESTMRNLKSLAPFAIELQPPNFIRRDDIDLNETPRARNQNVSDEIVLKILKDAGSLSQNEWQNHAATLGLNKRQFESIAGKLRSSGEAIITQENGEYLWKPKQN